MITNHDPFPFADIELARRLERTEGQSNAASVEARARISPGTGAAWIEIAGAYAMFDGAESPLTQTFGLGLFAPAGPAEVAAIERFFQEREAPVFHEVCPLAGAELAAMLAGRGYRPIEFTSVMCQPIVPGRVTPAPPGDRVQVRVVGPGDHEVWARTAAAGWSEFPEVEPFMREIGPVTTGRDNATCFLATLDNRPIATGVLSICDGVALLAGASTVPGGRRQGAQLALLHARLQFAAEAGCDLAMMCAAPGSASQRNAERHGFRIAYTRLKWGRSGSPTELAVNPGAASVARPGTVPPGGTDREL